MSIYYNLLLHVQLAAVKDRLWTDLVSQWKLSLIFKLYNNRKDCSIKVYPFV